MPKTKFKIPNGWRILKGTDIIRATDLQWIKGAYVDFIHSNREVVSVVSSEEFAGRTVNDVDGDCIDGEWPNNFFRRC